MKYLLLLLIGLYSSSARKEDFEGLEYLMNNPKLLSDLEKRLGDLLSDDNSGSENAEAELPCNATIGTLNSAHSRCTFETDEDQIIKTTESINNGAKFVGKVENILCAKDCTMKCCNNSECDTAVYQDKDDHKCYMFKCGSPSVCVFDAHINYRVSYFKSKLEKSSFVPDVTHLSHENELENLDSHIMEPEPAVTIAPTTVEPLLTTTVRPALGESCKYFGPRCLDPHAECYMRECSCRAGYREKYGICRKICRQEEFECDNEGLGADAPQCVHGSYRCDGHRDCVDGSDEYNCPKIDEENQPGHKTENQDSEYKPKGPVESLDHAEKTVIAKPPKTVQGTDTDEDSSDLGTQGAPSPDENTQDDNSNPAVAPKAPEAPPAKVITTLAPSIDDKEDSGSENQTPEEKYKNSNSSNTKDSEESVFTYFSSEDKQKVESYTDSSQGPIVALALGLAITLILLIFVGCRLRTVKRRLRKGRALHSNEADYLINGMYL